MLTIPLMSFFSVVKVGGVSGVLGTSETILV